MISLKGSILLGWNTSHITEFLIYLRDSSKDERKMFRIVVLRNVTKFARKTIDIKLYRPKVLK